MDWKRFVVAVAVTTIVFSCVMAAPGCGRNVPYPKPKVTSPVGREGGCMYCGKRIESVTEDNLFVIEGVQYVVCDKKCADGVKKRLKQLDER